MAAPERVDALVDYVFTSGVPAIPSFGGCASPATTKAESSSPGPSAHDALSPGSGSPEAAGGAPTTQALPAAAEGAAAAATQTEPHPLHPLLAPLEPELLSRYPSRDNDECSMPDHIQHFCFPNGCRLVAFLGAHTGADDDAPVGRIGASASHGPLVPRPSCHTWALTELSGTRIYGAAIVFYEKLDAAGMQVLADAVNSWNKRRQESSDPSRNAITSAHLAKKLGDEDRTVASLRLQLAEVESRLASTLALDPVTRKELESTVALLLTRINESIENRAWFSSVVVNEGFAVVSPSISTVYVPRALSLLSRWPFLSFFSDYLAAAYATICASPLRAQTATKLLRQLCHQIPVPPPGKLEVLTTVGDTLLYLSRPPVNEFFPLVMDFSMRTLFSRLNTDSVLYLFRALLLEQRVLLSSQNLRALHICAESLIALLYPMQWQHIYIPLLPQRLLSILQAPMPFLIGVHADYAPKDIPEGVFWVDLDKNSITPGANVDTLADIPSHLLKKFRAKMASAHVAAIFGRNCDRSDGGEMGGRGQGEGTSGMDDVGLPEVSWGPAAMRRLAMDGITLR